HVGSTGSPSSTMVDQDAPSPSKSHSTTEIKSSVIPQDVEDDNLDMKVAHMGNGSVVWCTYSKSYFCAIFINGISSTYKEALTQSCWIEAMQEELNEFELLTVWELVPRPDKVMLKKALYGLKQAPRAWYDMLSSFLLSQDFSKGSVDPTLFIRRNGNDLLLMSMMGKISFFLVLQISQSPRGIFINQSKYDLESLKKYGFEYCDPLDTPMVEKSNLDEDKEGKAFDPSHYRGMIGTLLYLTASRPDLQFSICMCARQKSSAISSMKAKYIALSGCCA
nr:hypothetical protein [Tanacetum cinerariifolium]